MPSYQRIIPVVCPNCAHPFEVDTLAYRFWRLVDQTAGPEACWPWQGNIGPNGYGMVTAGSATDDTKRLMGSHRLAYCLAHHIEEIPSGIVVRHKCDFKRCCNPLHLELGTHTDNARDRVERGRDGHKGKQRSVCKNGHDLTNPENVLTSFNKRSGKTERRCRICTHERAREFYDRNPGYGAAKSHEHYWRDPVGEAAKIRERQKRRQQHQSSAQLDERTHSERPIGQG